MSYITKGNPYGLFEKQTLSPDGVTDTFTLNYRPGQSGAILVIYSGVIQEPGTAYTLIDGGTKLKMAFIPDGSELLYVLYLGRELAIPTVSGNYPIHDTAVGDGSNTSFSLSATPAEAALMVYADGILQSFGNEWSLSGDQVIFASAPAVGAKLDFYIHGIERTDLSTVLDSSITASKLNLNYIPYIPGIVTFNGMGKLPPTIEVSKYLPLGNFVKIRLKFSVVFTDVPDNVVRFTLPPGNDNDGTGLIAGNVVISKDTVEENGLLRWAGPNSIDIKRPGSANYTIGEEWTFEVSFDYDVT